MKLYVTSVNADRTEGRGPMLPDGVYVDLERAVASVQGKGVMGVGDGEVSEIELVDGVFTGYLLEEMVYGYRKRPDGRWDYGYVDFRDLHNDPEYPEYLRLKGKFE